MKTFMEYLKWKEVNGVIHATAQELSNEDIGVWIRARERPCPQLRDLYAEQRIRGGPPVMFGG